MEYINQTEFLKRYPAYEDMTEEITTSITDAKSIIDSYLKNRFTLEGNVPAILKRIASDLTCYYLQIMNLQAQEEDSVHQLYNHSIKMLKDIASGEIAIDLESNTDSNSVVAVISSAGAYEYRDN